MPLICPTSKLCKGGPAAPAFGGFGLDRACCPAIVSHHGIDGDVRLIPLQLALTFTEASYTKYRTFPCTSPHPLAAPPTAWGATYDGNSWLTSVSYASSFVAKYAYTNLGYANQLLDSVSGEAYWTANAMDAEQYLTQQNQATASSPRAPSVSRPAA